MVILHNESTWAQYRRRQRTISPAKLEFMVTQIEEDSRFSIIRLFGVTREGDSVHCALKGFYHYFYCEMPPSLHASQLDDLRVLWNKDLESRTIRSIEAVRRETLAFYKSFDGADPKQDFLKITLNNPRDMRIIKPYIALGNVPLPNGQRCSRVLQMYEEDGVDFISRFMCDNNVVGFGWCRLDQYTLVSELQSTTTFDVTCTLDNFHAFTPKDDPAEFGAIAPLRIVDFDIECMASKGFPTPTNDPVIMIGVQVHDGQRLIIDTVLFTSSDNTVNDWNDVVLARYDTEEQLLFGFAKLCSAIDYDISRNYNGKFFDWPYLFDRATVLNMDRRFCEALSRLVSTNARIFPTYEKMQSGQYDRHITRTITIPGRSDFDICSVVKAQEKLVSYRLNAVSLEYLGQTKEDVHHSMISVLYNGSAADRLRLARYCRKDAMLCKMIDEKQMYLLRYIEQARVCRVLLDVLVDQGQQAKVLALILEKGLRDGLVLPIKRMLTSYKPTGQFEGGLVLEPDIGFHERPIVCLDFNSLYPSEGTSQNYCYTTLLRPEDVARMKPEDVNISPAGHAFVRQHIKRGLLPRLWIELLAARKVAKNDMKRCFDLAKSEKDPVKKSDFLFQGNVQNARQLAIKLVANAMYGFTGVDPDKGGYLPCFEVSEAITSSGRNDLQAVINWIKLHYPEAKVRYGDTDSVMVEPGCTTVKDAMEWMHKVAKEINKDIYSSRDPMKLAPEKVMWPTLFQAKKHYIAGYYEESAETMDKIYYKGIEVVRRDACQLMRTCLEECCDKIFRDRDVSGAVEIAKRTIERLYKNEVDMSELVISKSLSQNPDDYSSAQAHTMLAQKMAKRDPNNAPSVGDRIPYVMVGSGTKDVRFLSEDPLYALEHEMPINVEYYIENQLKKPLQRLFQPIIGERKTQQIFSGEHTRTRVQQQSSKKQKIGIMSFIRVTRSCSSCSQSYDPEQHRHASLCPTCLEKNIDSEESMKKEVYSKTKALYDEQFAICQKCQGSDRDPVLCMASDCVQLYKRKAAEFRCTKALQDLEDIHKFMPS
uniref:DNA-directed DNA polymerase n=1 Tax=viral metagenome TaxID=1070528 RepID=A0A6C0IZL6_9ZZZZ